jgi:hypothetical protein
MGLSANLSCVLKDSKTRVQKPRWADESPLGPGRGGPIEMGSMVPPCQASEPSIPGTEPRRSALSESRSRARLSLSSAAWASGEVAILA